MTTFVTEVELGQRYRDKHTNYEGVAISVHFYEHSEPKTTLRALVDNKVNDQAFDVSTLLPINGDKRAGFSPT